MEMTHTNSRKSAGETFNVFKRDKDKKVTPVFIGTQLINLEMVNLDKHWEISEKTFKLSSKTGKNQTRRSLMFDFF